MGKLSTYDVTKILSSLTKKQTNKKAVIYARYSSHNQREESIDAQLRECHDYAKRNGFIVLEEYCDRALSAKTDNRASFQRLIKDARSQAFNYVLVYKLDRFARNRHDSRVYKDLLKEFGVKVVSIKEDIPDTPEGIILESVLEGVAEYYSANHAQNVIRGMTENALKSKYNGSGCPLGYKITPDKYFEIDPIGEKIVQEIFTMYGDGKTSAEIIRYCNDKGYKTSRGQAFNKSSIYRIVTNDRYLGIYRHGDIVNEGGIPQIISKELFDKVQKIVNKNKSQKAKGKAKTTYLLSGKVFCGHCGNSLIGECGTSKVGKIYNYYKCYGRKVLKNCNKATENQKWLEEIVVKTIVEKVLTDDNIQTIATKVMELVEEDSSTAVELKHYKNELKETQKKIKNIVDMIADGLANKSVAEKLTELENYEKDILLNIEFLSMKKPTLTHAQIVYWLETFKEGDVHDDEYKRKVINALLHSVYVYDTDDGGKKLVLNFNTSENSTAEVKCSDSDSLTPPIVQNPNTIYIMNYDVFSFATIIEKDTV